ncbi:MAG: TolC family protein [Alphaproteobacteria bacterium]
MKAVLKAVSFMTFFCLWSCKTSVEPLSDWDRAVRVDSDVRAILEEQSSRKIEKPITLYDAMAYALKYNMDRRLNLLKEALAVKNYNINELNALPSVAVNAGFKARSNDSAYRFKTDSGDSGTLYQSKRPIGTADVQVAWNILDFGMSYYQAKQDSAEGLIIRENRRKIIHNLLQDVRSGYWKALTAQRTIPDIDVLLENIVIAVEKLEIEEKEINEADAVAADNSDTGGEDTKSDEVKESQEVESGKTSLQKRAELLEAMRDLRALKQQLQEDLNNFTDIIGLLPGAKFTLVGPERGNFTLPSIKTKLARIEWLSLMNRPELRVKDYEGIVNSFEVRKAILSVFPELEMVGAVSYEDNPLLFNKTWAEIAFKMGLNLLNPAKLKAKAEKAKVQEEISAMEREAMTMGVLTQVHLAWGRYMATRDNYEIEEEISKVVNRLAEKSAQEIYKNEIYDPDIIDAAAKALLATVRKDIAFADLQDATGDVFVTIGLDPFPDHLTNQPIDKISKVLSDVMTAWNQGRFTPEDMPKPVPVPTKRPSVYVGDLPEVTISEAEILVYKIPESIFDTAQLGDEVMYTASLSNGSPLPRWLYFDAISCTFSGQPKYYIGKHEIRVTAHNNKGETAHINFNLNVRKAYVPRVDIPGSRIGSRVMVIDHCGTGDTCENYSVTKHREVPRRVMITPTVKQENSVEFNNGEQQ